MTHRLRNQFREDAEDRSGAARYRAWVGVVLIFISLLATWALITSWYRDQLLAERRAQLAADVAHDGNALISAINRRVVVLQSLAAFILSHHDETDMVEETNLSSTWLQQNVSGIDYISIAPGGIQSYVFPATAGAALPDTDLLHAQSPAVQAAITRALEGRQVALGDVIQLASGERQIVAYYPVYRDEELWGLVTLGMNFQTVVDEASLGTSLPDIDVMLRNDWGRILYGTEAVLTRTPVTYHLIGLQHDWLLAAAPHTSWDALIDDALWPFQAAGLLVVSLLTMLTVVIINQQTRLTAVVRQRTSDLLSAQDDLEAHVKQRTAELTAANAELSSEIAVRKRVTQQLRESEALYRTLITTLPDAVTFTNREGQITFASAKAVRIFGCEDAAEMVGQPLLRGVIPAERARARAWLQHLLDGTQLTDSSQFTLRRKDGSHFIGDVDSASLYADDGRLYGLLSITRDITQRVEMEAALRRAHAELELRVQERTAELSQINEALRASEAKFRTIVEHSSDGITLVDEAGLVLEWNRGQELITGIPRAEALGQPIWNVQARLALPEQQSPERHRRVTQLGHEFLATGRLPANNPSVERPILRPDGTQRIIQPLPSPIRTERGFMIVSITRDVTERKQVEEALRESEMRFRTVANFTYDWEYWQSPTGEVLYMSPSCKRVTGYPDQDFINDPALLERIMHPDDRTDFMSHSHQTAQHGDTTPIDYRIIRSDGTIRWIGHVCRVVFDEQGRPLGRRVSNRDITERRRAEEGLREQEKLYRSIFETTADGLAICNLDGQIMETNPAFCEMHGYQSEEILGRRIMSFVHPTHRHRFIQSVQAIQTGSTFEDQTVHLRKDDQPFHVEVHAVGLTYYGRAHMLYIVRDVSPQVEAYLRLEQRVQERTHELSMLLEFSHSMTRTLEMKPLLRLILNQLRSVVDYTGATILSIAGPDLIVVAHQGPVPEAEMRRLRFSVDSPLGRAVFARMQPAIIADVQSDSALARAFQATVDTALTTTLRYIRAWLGIPLIMSERIIGMLAISHAQPNYFTQRHADLALAFANQAVLAMENARLYEQAQDLATMQERQRLARDLHDSVSQTLFSASLTAQVLPRLWERHPDEARQGLDELSRLTRGALAEMRTLLVELRPNVLVESKLGDLLQQLADAVTSRTRVPIQVVTDGYVPLPPDIQEALYRIAQESLNNIAKHAHASQALVHLKYRTASNGSALDNDQSLGVELSVSDNGRGFNQTGISADHLGLGIMRERAEAIQADFVVDSQPDRGTQVIVRWPKLPSSELT